MLQLTIHVNNTNTVDFHKEERKEDLMTQEQNLLHLLVKIMFCPNMYLCKCSTSSSDVKQFGDPSLLYIRC